MQPIKVKIKASWGPLKVWGPGGIPCFHHLFPRKMGTLGLYSPGSIYRVLIFSGTLGPGVPILEGPHSFLHTDISVKGNQTPQPYLYPPPQLTVYKHLRKRIW